VPLVPDTVTVYTPAVPEQDRVEGRDAPSERLAGLRAQVRPDGEDDDVSVIGPVNPLIGETVMVELACEPALTLALMGLADIEKSVTTTLPNAE
jgi:hypothetical protein